MAWLKPWCFNKKQGRNDPPNRGETTHGRNDSRAKRPGTVQNNGEFSNQFPVANGVKQGCVIASTLFSMMFSAMLTDAFQDGDNGIPIRYRFDGKCFNLRRLQAKSKVQTEVLDEFLFANDMAKGAPTEEKMQKVVDQVSDSCDSYDCTISIKKTVSQHLESLTRSLPSQ